ncbi:MAG: hypothetical protein AAF791_03540 [Bacteroidota bacterium]
MSPSAPLLVWTWDNGSVPPRYRKSRRVTVDASGRVVRTERRGYSTGDVTRTTGQIDPDLLVVELQAMGVLSQPWAAEERPRIGGGGSTLRLSLDGREVAVPRNVIATQRDAKERVVEWLRTVMARAFPDDGAAPSTR